MITALVILFGIAAAAILFSFGIVNVPGDAGSGSQPTTDPVMTDTRPKRPTGTLKITSDLEGAYVYSQVKGSSPRYLGQTPLESTLRVGSYKIYVFRNGVLLERDVEIAQDAPNSWAIKLAGQDDGMLYLPKGTCIRGSDDKGESSERPERRVLIRAFYIDKHEVSNLRYSLFLAYVNAEPQVAYKLKHEMERVNGERRPSHQDVMAQDSSGGFSDPMQPICSIDWWDAYHYARWAGKRLPTEAEWEKAAGWDDKAKKRYDYPWGSEFDKNKGHFNYPFGRSALVTAYPSGASPVGALNMAGNVAEWCNDWYGKYYYREKVFEDPQGPEYLGRAEAKKQRKRPIHTKVIRGGSGNYFQRFKPIEHRHVTYARLGINPDFRHQTIGFRCARTATKEDIAREQAKKAK